MQIDQAMLRTMIHGTIDQRRELCGEIQKTLREKVLGTTDKSDITILNASIGSPSSACISLGFDNNLKTLVVVKEVLYSNGQWRIPLEALYEMQSFEKIRLLKSKHLQHIINIHIDRNSTKIISKHLPNSFDKLFAHRTPPDFCCLKSNELITVVKSLHQVNIAHRDIKTNNICFNDDGQLVLIDFDCASPNSSRSTLPISTVNFRAPELSQLYRQHQLDGIRRNYDAFACDWWSTGCVIAQMFLGDPLFSNEATAKEQPSSAPPTQKFIGQQDSDILADKMVAFSIKLRSTEGHSVLKRIVPESFYALLQNLLSLEPQERIDAANKWVNE